MPCHLEFSSLSRQSRALVGQIDPSTQLKELEALKTDIDKGLADMTEGRVKDFDTDRIIKRGRKLLAAREPAPVPNGSRP